MNYFFFPKGAQTPTFGSGINKEEFMSKKEKATRILDKAVYLSVMNKVWRETSLVLQDSAHQENPKLTVDSFWVENKYLLDYVNAVYNLKEFLENYDHVNDYRSRIYSPVNKAYKDINGWFRFICEFRNCLIHHYGLVKDVDMKGKLWVCYEEFINAEQNQLNHDLSIGKTGIGIYERQDFISHLKTISGLQASNGNHYDPAYIIVEKADVEIGIIMREVYDVLFTTKVQRALNDLLSFVQRDETGYHNTVYVEEDFSYEPCVDIESYLLYFTVNAGPDSALTNHYVSHLQKAGYQYLIAQNKETNTQEKTIDDFLENARKREY